MTDDLAAALSEHFGDQPAYLVGGCVRDRLLGRRFADLDLIVTDSLRHARALARRLGAAFVPLDAERGTARLVLADGGQIDLSEPGGSLDQDLRRRDFTINAIACPLAEWPADTPTWIDPTGGLADLAAGVVRAAGEGSLADDPLRCLRAYRFAVQLGFVIEPATREQIRAAAPGLATIASERVLQEWLPLIEAGAAADGLADMAADRVLEELLPGAQVGDVPLVDAALGELAGWPRLAQWLTPVHRGLVRFAALSGPAGTGPTPAWLAARFAPSRQQRRLLRALREAPGELESRRDLAALVIERGESAIGCLALAKVWLGWPSARLVTTASLLAEGVLPAFDRPPLVTGTVLQESLHQRPGPAFGPALAAARLAQLAGEVDDAPAALAVAAAVLKAHG